MKIHCHDHELERTLRQKITKTQMAKNYHSMSHRRWVQMLFTILMTFKRGFCSDSDLLTSLSTFLTCPQMSWKALNEKVKMLNIGKQNIEFLSSVLEISIFSILINTKQILPWKHRWKIQIQFWSCENRQFCTKLTLPFWVLDRKGPKSFGARWF